MAKKKVSKASNKGGLDRKWEAVDMKPVKKKVDIEDTQKTADDFADEFCGSLKRFREVPKKKEVVGKAEKIIRSRKNMLDEMDGKAPDEEKIKRIAEKVVKGLDKEIEGLGRNMALYVIEAVDKVGQEREEAGKKVDSAEELDIWQVVLNVKNRDGLYVMQEVKASKYIATGSYIEFISEGNVVALFNSNVFLYAVRVKPSVSDCTCEEGECVCDCTEGKECNDEVKEIDWMGKDAKGWNDLLEYRSYVVLQIQNDLEKHRDHWIKELEETDKMIREYKNGKDATSWMEEYGIKKPTAEKKY